MQVRCPNCRSTIQLAANETLDDVNCEGCGTSINLVSPAETIIGDVDIDDRDDQAVIRTVGHFQLQEQLRAECLNENRFLSLEDANLKIAPWRQDYDNHRPHSALGNLVPGEFAKSGQGSQPG